MSSRTVVSNQSGLHQNLELTVRKHLEHPWQKPYQSFSAEIFSEVTHWLGHQDQPWILDSGCGIGESTVHLANQFPEYKVLGFDRSEVRLDKLKRKRAIPDNCFVVRANAEDLWRQLVAAKLQPTHHFILFPNPYPKAAQLNKRWHGSPLFPYLLQLGGLLELRSNWRVYLEEFGAALQLARETDYTLEAYSADAPITAFEAKYATSGQQLWRLTTQIVSK